MHAYIPKKKEVQGSTRPNPRKTSSPLLSFYTFSLSFSFLLPFYFLFLFFFQLYSSLFWYL